MKSLNEHMVKQVKRIDSLHGWAGPCTHRCRPSTPGNPQDAGRARFPATAALCLLAAAAWFSGCSKGTAPKPDLLARVGAVEIRVPDFQREAAWRQKQRRPAADKQALLDEMILSEALLQRARSAGLDTDLQLQREIRNLIIGKLLDREMASRQDTVTVSPEEVQAAYERNLAQHTRPAKARFAGLFLEADRKASDAKRAAVQARLEEARRLAVESAQRTATPLTPGLGPLRGEGENGFGALALNYSDDQSSRYRGGDIGWIEAGGSHSRWPQTVLAAGFALEPGQMSDVLEASGGFYLIMKTDARPRAVTPFEQVEGTLRQSLLLKKRQEIDRAYRQETVARVPVQIAPSALAALALPAAPAALAQQQGPPALPGMSIPTRP